MENPLVSIYITNRNYGAYLEKAIQSSLDQTYKNIEIIIIDIIKENNLKTNHRFINIMINIVENIK